MVIAGLVVDPQTVDNNPPKMSSATPTQLEVRWSFSRPSR
jgi:hypothetical protein